MFGGLQEWLWGAFGGGLDEEYMWEYCSYVLVDKTGRVCGTQREKRLLRFGSRVDRLGYLLFIINSFLT